MRYLRSLPLLALLVLSGISCQLLGTDGADVQTGLEGQVLAGPTCPVQHAGAPCPDRPFSALFGVRTAGGLEAGTFRSDSDGHFRISLPPGAYVVTPDASAPLLNPSAQRQTVTVGPNTVTRVILRFDTGIR